MLIVVGTFLLVGGAVFGVSSSSDRGAWAVRADPDEPPVSSDPGVVSTVPPTPAPTAEPPPWTEPATPDTAWTPETTVPEWEAPVQESEQWVPESAVPTDPPQSTQPAPMTTTENLLIGPSTTPAPSTTVERRSLSGSSVTRTDGSSDPKVWAVVAGLGAVAVGLGVATFLYWRRTRPDGEDSGGDRPRSRFSDLTITTPDPG